MEEPSMYCREKVWYGSNLSSPINPPSITEVESSHGNIVTTRTIEPRAGTTTVEKT